MCGDVRVFVGAFDEPAVVELKPDGTFVRKVRLFGLQTGITTLALALALGDGRLFVCDNTTVATVSLADHTHQQLQRQDLWPDDAPPWSALVVDDMLLLALHDADRVEIVPITTVFG
jgi:hypothetical protein